MVWYVDSVINTEFREGKQFNKVNLIAQTTADVANLPVYTSKKDVMGVASGIPLPGSLCQVVNEGNGLKVAMFDGKQWRYI